MSAKRICVFCGVALQQDVVDDNPECCDHTAHRCCTRKATTVNQTDRGERLEASERKLLFVFVREVLAHPGDDRIAIAGRNPKTVQALRALGFIATNEDSLTRESYLAYFKTFEELECPPEVQQWVDRFGITDLHWRKPAGIIKDRMPQELGKAYPPLATVFIGRRRKASSPFPG